MRQLPSLERHIVFGGELMAPTTYVRSCSHEILPLERVYTPEPDARDYIVTPAVAGNGSTTLGNFVLARSEREA